MAMYDPTGQSVGSGGWQPVPTGVAVASCGWILLGHREDFAKRLWPGDRPHEILRQLHRANRIIAELHDRVDYLYDGLMK